MARDFNYQPVDYILEQLSRIPHYNINEGNVITDISIALGFMVKNAVQEDAVAFLPVKNNIAEMPEGYTQIHRVSKYNKNVCLFEEEDFLTFLTNEKEHSHPHLEVEQDCEECQSDEDLYNLIQQQNFIAMKYPYGLFLSSYYYKKAFTPVRPSNNIYISSLACKDEHTSEVYNGCSDEYTIQKGLNKKLILSFCEGYIAVAYKRPLTDDSTGYPLIPDDSNANEAILAFVKAKIFEELAYAGREGYYNMAENERVKWGKYLKQFNNSAKMPQTEDDYQSDLESKLGSYPNRSRYYGNFSNVARRRKI